MHYRARPAHGNRYRIRSEPTMTDSRKVSGQVLGSQTDLVSAEGMPNGSPGPVTSCSSGHKSFLKSMLQMIPNIATGALGNAFRASYRENVSIAVETLRKMGRIGNPCRLMAIQNTSCSTSAKRYSYSYSAPQRAVVPQLLGDGVGSGYQLGRGCRGRKMMAIMVSIFEYE
jgi:hypothetical protein